MERFCITLEQAKRLKELGFERFSTYWWVNLFGEFGLTDLCSFINEAEEKCPAFHVGELLEIMPNEIDDGSGNYFLTKNGSIKGVFESRQQMVN